MPIKTILLKMPFSLNVKALFLFLFYAVSTQGQVLPRPCRTNDSLNADVLFVALGNPDLSRVTQGDFDLANDRIIKNGKVVYPNYFKQTLGLKYFQPIDKSVFKVSASGWCSWYYYYQGLDMKETLLNTKWLSENLKDYGLKYIQIDDAWQDKGKGDHDNRDWMTINNRFSKFGMDSLAGYIKTHGFVPALWIVPHGQSNLKIAKESGAFMLDKNGKSTMKANWSWVGDYQIDPTSPRVKPYFKKLFSHFQTKGYEYFKVDGQSVILPDYLKNQKSFSDPKQDPIVAYRNTLRSIRESVGKEVYLLGCWRTPVEALGYFNGSRSNGDVWGSISGFGQVLEAVRAGYFLHNTAWYVDPDPVMVGSPLSEDMARVWASIVGLTGMATFCTEKMQDLSPKRVDILKKIFPAQDVYPVDLFRYSKNKSIVDLKVGTSTRKYDVVGVFNFDNSKQSTTHLDWTNLGLERDTYYHVYNFWDEEYVGCFNYGLFVNLRPASCNVLSITKADTLPQLISTNRHITQGALDVESITYGEANSQSNLFKISGESKVIGKDEYKLVFGLPMQGKNGFKISKVTFNGKEGKVSNSKGAGFASFIPESTGKVSWEVSFERVENVLGTQVGDFNEKLKLTNVSLNKVKFNFDKSYGISFGFLLEKNGVPLGYSIESPIYLNRAYADKGATYTATETFSNFRPSETRFSVQDTAKHQSNKIIISSDDANGAVCYVDVESADHSKGYLFFSGDGTKRFPLEGKFRTLNGAWKVDNGSAHYKTKARFQIWGDGKVIYDAPLQEKGTTPLKFTVEVDQIKEIVFKTVFQQEASDWGSLHISDIELVSK
jgi:hypothetical protein